ncbi:U3 small nucleolar RNA-associated protein 5 [Coccidioides immitis RMSCC 3703]|uniref:U3 small nucleolar RNA-associated protein 5 n=1 Tax=Coccidioides immitis RMSCC 3703 TaxID=454286 RepID=A0A0J8QWQ6_COCIT|nr:U3 small nucleolar RNA-associated protein 5 [Coccidioides immitis RMSCC 3703]
MPTKKRSRGPVSKISAAAAASSGTQITVNKSSVIRSSFSPSEYQLALFASVIQGLDAQHLRVHDVNSGRLRCEHAVNPKEVITSLDWGYHGDADRDQHLKKKRKRSSGVNAVVDASEPGDAVVAFGTNTSEIRMQLLAAVTRDGAIELFSNPFHQEDAQSVNATASLKSRLKAVTRRSDATVKIVRPDASRTVVPVVAVSFDGSDLVVAWAEAGANVVFDRIRWRDEETKELILQGESEIARGKSASMVGSAMMNGAKNMGKSHVDESHTVVEQGGVAEGIMRDGVEEDASGLSNDEEEASDVEQEKANEIPSSHSLAKAEDNDVDMADVDAEEEEEEEEEEEGGPSFGELLRANSAKHIDVAAELDEAEVGALVSTRQPKSLQQLPSGLSLATVLSQSLKTNDHNLLESCFHTTDVNIVRATIQRLDSSLAATLLQKLAERLASRPGRYGHLLVWVQWTCVAHGGSIAGKPEILKQMTSLFKVMDQRSSSLSSLLLLKGKLDMLDAQLGLRRSLNQNREGRFESDEDDVIYVEGQEDEVETEDDERLAIEDAGARQTRDVDMGDITGDEEDGEDMPMVVNGAVSESGEDEGDEEDDELFDDEAVESEDGEGASEEEDDEDEDEEEDEDLGSMADFIADSDEESEILVDPPASTKKSKIKKGKTRG